MRPAPDRGPRPAAGLDRRRILLVHPLGYRADAAARDIARQANLMPPLGLASLAAYVEQRGFAADLIDCFCWPDSDDRLRAALTERRPAFLGLSCTTSSFLDAVRLLELAKTVAPGIQGVLGGPHVSALRESLLERWPIIDFAVVGEGERPLVQLLERAGRDGLAEVPGLVYREPGGTVRFTGFQDRGLELDELPFPAYEKLAGYPGVYRLPIFNYPRTPNASCISSRGCPYQCSYCDRSVFGRSFRWNSAAYVYEHLRYLRERFGIRHLNFYDDQFTFHRPRVEEFCRLLLDRPLGLTFNCAVRAEHIDLDLLRLMKAAGAWMVSLGIESGDPELLAQHRQRADLELLAARLWDIKRAGLRTKGLLMMGLPGESEASIRRSMAYVFSLPIDDFNLAKFTPFPGAPLYARIRDEGEFVEDWERMDCMHFVFVPKGMTRAQLERLFTEFYRRHFQRPKVLWGYATMLWRSPDSWRRFAGNLGSFLRFARSSQRLGEG